MPRRRSGRKIDFVHWTGIHFAQGTLGAGTIGALLLAAQHDPETHLRLRAHFLAYVDGLQAPGLEARISMGVIYVPEGTGSTVLWSPETDGDAPWIWYSSFVLGHEEVVADSLHIPGLMIHREVVDSKAMRVVRNQELQIVFENTTIAGAVSANLAFDGRVLSGT